MPTVYATPCYNVFISTTGYRHDSRAKETPAEKEAGKEVIVGLAVIAFIIIALLRAGDDDKRVFPISAVLCITFLSYSVYYYGSYDTYVELLGYYAYHSIWLLATIAILSFMRGKLAFCLMGLFCFEIAFNACYFLIEGAGIYADTFYQIMQWLLYTAEVSLMFSRRLTDGVMEYFAKMTWPEILQRVAIMVTIAHVALKIYHARKKHERSHSDSSRVDSERES